MGEADKISEVGNLIKQCLAKNRTYSKEQIEFTHYCREKMEDRNIESEQVIGTLEGRGELYFARVQIRDFRGVDETRYKLIYKISSKYSLILIVVYNKVLKVLNAIKTSKGAEKLWRKEMLK